MLPAAAKEDYVLILNCYLESVQWKGNIEDAVTQYLSKELGMTVHTEHVRALDIKTKQQQREKLDSLYQKYPNRPEAVIYIGVAAWELFAEGIETRWKNIPMINCSIRKNTISLDNLLNQREVTKEEMIPVDLKELQRKYNMTAKHRGYDRPHDQNTDWNEPHCVHIRRPHGQRNGKSTTEKGDD